MNEAQEMVDERKGAAIIGLGLIGGSIGMALVRSGWRVSFVDPAVETAESHAKSAAHEKLKSIAEADERALVILATPVDVALEILHETDLGNRIVTSVCSVMHPLERVGSERSLRFVAGHPFTGSERAGLGFASEGLFVGRNWFIDRAAEYVPVIDLIEATGATPVPIDPGEHDRLVALTSHLPQILSTALASAVTSEGESAADFLGSGLRTFLRLAGSNSSVWEPVIAANREPIVSAKRNFDRALQRILDGEGDADFRRAVDVYGKLHEPHDGGEGES